MRLHEEIMEVQKEISRFIRHVDYASYPLALGPLELQVIWGA